MLSAYLADRQHFADDFWKGKRVLELGAGAGMCGLTLGMLGAIVIVTELAEVVPVLKENIEINRLQHACTAEELPWGEHQSFEWFQSSAPFDVVIGCEVAYAVSFQKQLVETLVASCKRETLVFIGHEHRWKDVDEWFLEEIGKYFECETIPLAHHNEYYRCPNISIYKLRLRV